MSTVRQPCPGKNILKKGRDEQYKVFPRVGVVFEASINGTGFAEEVHRLADLP